jgi:hypothetical protein
MIERGSTKGCPSVRSRLLFVSAHLGPERRTAVWLRSKLPTSEKRVSLDSLRLQTRLGKHRQELPLCPHVGSMTDQLALAVENETPAQELISTTTP